MESPPIPESKTPTGCSKSALLIDTVAMTGRLHESAEQTLCRRQRRKPLWMPLDGQAKRVPGQLHGLHKPIWSPSGHQETSSNVFEPLMMMAVDFQDGFLENRCGVGSLLDLHLMHQSRSKVARISV